MAKKILVVDDSKTIREMVGHALRRAEYDVTVACDGLEALEAVNESKFELIITDINMPNMGGIELIKTLRLDERCKVAPILVLTTETDDGLRQEARAANATGWIVKPFFPEKLISVVNKVIA